MQEGHILLAATCEHQIEIIDQLADSIRVLIHGIICDPYIAIFYCLEICQKTVLGKKIIKAFHRGINAGIVNEIICINGSVVKLFHCNGYGGFSAVVLKVRKRISTACNCNLSDYVQLVHHWC